MRKIVLLFLLLFLSVGLRMFSQAGVPYLFNFGKGDYRAAGQNWAVDSDGCGRIYVGNSKGLLQYNGLYWHLASLPKGEYVRSIYVDGHGRIYVGSFEEFGYFTHDCFGHLVYTSLADSVADYTFHNDQIWDIAAVDGKVYFRSLSSYFVYDGEQVRAVSNPYILLLMQQVDGRLYAFKQGEGLGVLQDDGFELLHPVSLMGHSDVVALLPYEGERKLLVTNQGGVFVFDDQTCRPWLDEVNRQIRGEFINKAVMTKDSVYILGSLTNGMFAFDKRGKLQWHVNSERGLQNNTVLGLHCDTSNNVWVALDNGVSYIRHNSWARFIKPFKRDVGSVFSACFHQGYLYLATNQGLFFCRDNGRDFEAIPFPGMSSQAMELALFDGQLLCGHNSGTYEIDGERLVRLSDISGGTNLQRAVIHQQEVLVQSSYTYLNIYRKNAAGKWCFSHSITNFLQPIRNIEIDSQGNVWASHSYKGMFRLRLSSDLRTAETIEYIPQVGDSVNRDLVDIFKMRGRVVFSNGKTFYTHDDLHDDIIPYDLLNRAGDRLSGIKKAVGMDNDTYWCVRDEEFVKIHFAHDSITKERVIPFSLFQNELPDYDENIVKTADGRLIFCLNNGIAIVDDDAEVYPYPVMDGMRFESICAFASEERVVPLELKPGRMPVLPCTENNLTFRVSPEYFTATNIKFRFDLQGPYSEVSRLTASPEKTYNRLHWGKYKLVVQGYDNYGCSKGSVEYDFEIAPPFYASTWAYVLYAMLVLLFFVLLYVLTLRYVRLSKAKVAEEQEKLRQKERERQEKEIIRLRAQNLEAELSFKGKELASSTMMLIKKNEVLIEIKAELEAQKEKLGVHYPNKYFTKVIHLIDSNLSSEDDWKIFQANFDLIHENFFRNLRTQYPDLTPNDLKICSLLRLNLTTKDVANFLGISPRGVEIARYRLRKKLHLPTDKNLVDFLIEFK